MRNISVPVNASKCVVVNMNIETAQWKGKVKIKDGLIFGFLKLKFSPELKTTVNDKNRWSQISVWELSITFDSILQIWKEL